MAAAEAPELLPPLDAGLPNIEPRRTEEDYYATADLDLWTSAVVQRVAAPCEQGSRSLSFH